MSFTIDHLLPLIKQIHSSRFYETERGYQGRVNALLSAYLQQHAIFPPETIIEEEYQKTMKHHQIRQRPDMIIHIPIEAGLTENRVENNFYVMALKLRADAMAALQDFDSLDEMFGQLEYPEGVFINVCGYPQIHLGSYTGHYSARIHELAVRMDNDAVSVRHACYNNGQLMVQEV
jgi:hypothetical protein